LDELKMAMKHKSWAHLKDYKFCYKALFFKLVVVYK